MELPYQQRDQAIREQKADWRRRWFGPSRAEVWSALAGELDASFTVGKWCSGGRVVHHAGPWRLTLDLHMVSTGQSAVPYTRIRSPYLTTDNFRFSVYRGVKLLKPIADFFGAQDVLVGDAAFDEAYVVKATDEPKAKLLFEDPGIRQRLLAERHLTLSVKDDEGYFGPKFGADVDELSCVTLGDVRDLDRLHALFDLTADTLERLHDLGTAAEGETGVTL